MPATKFMRELILGWKLIYYSLAGYLIVSALHLFLSMQFFDSQPWLLSSLGGSPFLLYLMGMVLPLFTGIVLGTAALKRKNRLISYALGAGFIYELFIFILNVVNYAGRGTPAIPALGFASIFLLCYSRIFTLKLMG